MESTLLTNIDLSHETFLCQICRLFEPTIWLVALLAQVLSATAYLHH
jgi:hypothetical protein